MNHKKEYNKEFIEAYLLGQLSQSHIDTFEEHLLFCSGCREKLEELLDAEKRALIHQNENRLTLYLKAAEKWTATWLNIEKGLADMPILDAHKILTDQAKGVLPFVPKEIEI